MNELARDLILLVIQISIPLSIMIIIARRQIGPTTAKLCSLTSILILGLTVFVFLPKPTIRMMDFWQESQTETGETQERSSRSESRDPMIPGIDILQLIGDATIPTSGTDDEESFPLFAGIAWILIGVAIVGLLRFGISIFGMLQLRSSAMPIEDPVMMDQLLQLQSKMRITIKLNLMQSDRIAGAVLLPGCRPMIILGPDWREWSALEIETAIAHELAHLQGNDGRNRCIAHFVKALHGYHPLVRWLVQQLELAQEVTADAIASVHMGGKERYLRGLAQLALRCDAKPIGWCPSVVSKSQTWKRRIAMLSIKEDAKPTKSRMATVMIIGCAMISLALQNSSTQLQADSKTVAASSKESARTPLDWRLLLADLKSDKNTGSYVFRIGELAKHPLFHEMMRQQVKVVKEALEVDFDFKLEDIEQVAGGITFSVYPDQPKPNRSMMMSLSGIRMVKAFDWEKLLRVWFPKMETIQHHGKSYYRVGKNNGGLAAKFAMLEAMCFYQLDDRTLGIFGSQNDTREYLDALKKPSSEPSWAADWKLVEQQMFGVILPNPSAKLLPLFEKDPKDDAAETIMKATSRGLVEHAKQIIFGADLREERAGLIWQMTHDDPTHATKSSELLATLIKLGETAVKAMPKDEPSTREWSELFYSIRVSTKDEKVTITVDESKAFAALKQSFDSSGDPTKPKVINQYSDKP
jgi:beta-lactamase regulating signal transducer with metallopeptidase domain